MAVQNYHFLKIGRKVFTILAWVFLAIFLFVGISILAGGGNVGAPRAVGLFFFLWGATLFFVFGTASEIIRLLLEIASKVKS